MLQQVEGDRLDQDKAAQPFRMGQGELQRDGHTERMADQVDRLFQPIGQRSDHPGLVVQGPLGWFGPRMAAAMAVQVGDDEAEAISQLKCKAPPLLA
jgi:hypothetical protein